MTTPLAAPRIVGITVNSAVCGKCGTSAAVELAGPWDRGLDDQVHAAVAAATAECPHHIPPAAITSDSPAPRAYPYPLGGLGGLELIRTEGSER